MNEFVYTGLLAIGLGLFILATARGFSRRRAYMHGWEPEGSGERSIFIVQLIVGGALVLVGLAAILGIGR